MSQQKASVDKLLTNVSSGYFPEGMISEKCLPTIRSVQKTGKLGDYGTDHLRIENSLIGGQGEYRRIRQIVRGSSTYSVEGHGLEGIVTEDDYSNVELPYDAEEDQVLNLTSKLALEKEKALADTLADTAVLTQNVTLSGSNQFDDYLNSDPLDVLSDARASVKSGCGVPPSCAIVPWEVFNKLKYHPAFLASLGFKDNRPGGLTMGEFAQILEVKKLWIPEISYNSAKEGQTAVLAPVWGKHIIMAVCPDSAAKRQVSLGYLVNLVGRDKRRVFKYSISNPPNALGILVDDHYDMFISNALAGYLIKNAIA